MKTFIELPTPSTRIPNGSSAGGGIARRNCTIGSVARRSVRREPEREPEPPPRRRTRSRSRAPGARGTARRRCPPARTPTCRRTSRGCRSAAGSSRCRCRSTSTPHSASSASGTVNSSATSERARPHRATAALRRMPVQDAPLDAREDAFMAQPSSPVTTISAYMMSTSLALARDVDLAPEAGRADHELGGDGQDQRDRGARSGGRWRCTAPRSAASPAAAAAARENPNERAVSVATGSTSCTPYSVCISSGQVAANAARNTLLSRPVPVDQDRQRDQRDRRDRPQELDHRRAATRYSSRLEPITIPTGIAIARRDRRARAPSPAACCRPPSRTRSSPTSSSSAANISVGGGK